MINTVTVGASRVPGPSQNLTPTLTTNEPKKTNLNSTPNTDITLILNLN